MKPRSIVWHLYGEYIRYDGGEIAMGALIDLFGAFGVGPEAVRVVMSRMRREGWFDVRRDGRQSHYALTAHAWGVLDEGRSRIFERRREPWSGEWCMVVYTVPESARTTRDRLRSQLAWLGFGRLAPSTWICPHDKRAELLKTFAAEPEARFDVVMSRSLGLVHDREMAERCWDLPSLDSAYTDFLRRHRERLTRWEHCPAEGVEALVDRIALIHEYREFLFQDPDLPAELLPSDWPGRQAHDLFLAGIGALRQPALEHYRRMLAGAGGAGPPRAPGRPAVRPTASPAPPPSARPSPGSPNRSRGRKPR